MQLVIRQAMMKDLPNILRIESECFSDPWDSSPFLLLARNNGKLMDRDGEVRMIVGELHSKVIGYAIWEFDIKKKKGHILNLAIQEGDRRKGYASLLIHHILNSLRRANSKSCILEVRESNLAAQALYTKLGMKSIGRQVNYYGNEDGIIFEAKL